MARIRSIKPEMLTSPDVRKLSNAGKVAFLALITQADDKGRLSGFDAHHLATTYCAPGTKERDVAQQLHLMARLGMVYAYAIEGHEYLQLCNWENHQRIDRPTPSRIPEPTKIRRVLANSRRVLDEDSTSPRPSRARADRIGKERIGEDLSSSVSPTGSTVQVFEAWKASTGKTGRARLDAKRQRLIGNALKGYPVEDVLDAVDGWRFVAYNRGENEQQRKFNDLELLLRDSQHIERFRDAKRAQTTPTSNGFVAETFEDLSPEDLERAKRRSGEIRDKIAILAKNKAF